MDILHNIGELFLGAVPTIIVVLILYFFLKWAFFTPLQQAMADRKIRIDGARAEAVAAEAEARQETEAYHAALQKARAEIYGEQEAARQAELEGRAKLLKAVRSRAQEDVAAAKKSIDADLAAARAEVERQTPELASAIARAILQKPASPLGGGAAR
jgi:F-type H+-transporting ATPase subunit b